MDNIHKVTNCISFKVITSTRLLTILIIQFCIYFITPELLSVGTEMSLLCTVPSPSQCQHISGTPTFTLPHH
jgi:hypothetical protein